MDQINNDWIREALLRNLFAEMDVCYCDVDSYREKHGNMENYRSHQRMSTGCKYGMRCSCDAENYRAQHGNLEKYESHAECCSGCKYGFNAKPIEPKLHYG